MESIEYFNLLLGVVQVMMDKISLHGNDLSNRNCTLCLMVKMHS